MPRCRYANDFVSTVRAGVKKRGWRAEKKLE